MALQVRPCQTEKLSHTTWHKSLSPSTGFMAGGLCLMSHEQAEKVAALLGKSSKLHEPSTMGGLGPLSRGLGLEVVERVLVPRLGKC